MEIFTNLHKSSHIFTNHHKSSQIFTNNHHHHYHHHHHHQHTPQYTTVDLNHSHFILDTKNYPHHVAGGGHPDNHIVTLSCVQPNLSDPSYFTYDSCPNILHIILHFTKTTITHELCHFGILHAAEPRGIEFPPSTPFVTPFYLSSAPSQVASLHCFHCLDFV